MAITSRGPVRTASPLAERQVAVSEAVTPRLRNFRGSPDPTDAEIVAAVAKSSDLELITGAELLEAIDATRVAGMVSEHELDLVRWTLANDAEERGVQRSLPPSTDGPSAGDDDPDDDPPAPGAATEPDDESGPEITHEMLYEIRLKRDRTSNARAGSHCRPRVDRRGVCPTCEFHVPLPCVRCKAMGYLRLEGRAA